MVNRFLERRIVKLEGLNAGRPYEHLTDEELDNRIADFAKRIETEVASNLCECAGFPWDALQAREPLPEGGTKMDIRGIAAYFRDAAGVWSHDAE